MRRISWTLALFAVGLLASECGMSSEAAPAPSPESTAATASDLRLDENPPLRNEVREALERVSVIPDAGLDKVYRLEHRVPVGAGRMIALTETFTRRSWLRWPHRAIFMVPTQGSNRSVYNVPVAGYDGGAIMARQGFFAFTADPPGTGDSYQPVDGLSVTYESEAAVLAKAVDYVRRIRLVAKVDAFGEEIGGGVATHLCRDNTRIRSCVGVSMMYKKPSDFFYKIAPYFKKLVLSSPDGYFISGPESYFNVLAGASPEVSAWFLSTQPGRYAAGVYKQDFRRLLDGGRSYDPRYAAVPGLFIRGGSDPNTIPSDVQELARDYGSLGGASPAEVVIIPGGTHIVRLDAAPRGPMVWKLTKEFLERPIAGQH